MQPLTQIVTPGPQTDVYTPVTHTSRKLPEYHPTKNQDQLYHSICMMPQYKKFSNEELRARYEQNIETIQNNISFGTPMSTSFDTRSGFPVSAPQTTGFDFRSNFGQTQSGFHETSNNQTSSIGTSGFTFGTSTNQQPSFTGFSFGTSFDSNIYSAFQLVLNQLQQSESQKQQLQRDLDAERQVSNQFKIENIILIGQLEAKEERLVELKKQVEQQEKKTLEKKSKKSQFKDNREHKKIKVEDNMSDVNPTVVQFAEQLNTDLNRQRESIRAAAFSNGELSLSNGSEFPPFDPDRRHEPLPPHTRPLYHDCPSFLSPYPIQPTTPAFSFGDSSFAPSAPNTSFPSVMQF